MLGVEYRDYFGAMEKLFLWTLAISLLAAPAAAAPVPAGKWEMREIRDSNGAISHCVADHAYDNAMHINFALDHSGRMNIGIIVPNAEFGAGEKYSLRLLLPDGTSRISSAEARMDQMLLVEDGIDAEFRSRLKTSAYMIVLGVRDKIIFPLPDSGNMLRELAACAR